MDRRDLELLDKQLGHVLPPPRKDGVLALGLTVTFLAGVAFGGILMAREGETTMQMAALPAAAPANPAP